MVNQSSNRNSVTNSTHMGYQMKNVEVKKPRRRIRPMSAKNPMMQNRLNKNEVSEPQIFGEDIINIQNQVIREEDQAETTNDEPK